ncbi:MAG TPA: histidine kinase dimerization/phosphoacceptor domain -containing protein [Geothrix sp.]|nr:histidine kinase dimerization/phosphoacceptor domain -containing protein [Geothrix sp.]
MSEFPLQQTPSQGTPLVLRGKHPRRPTLWVVLAGYWAAYLLLQLGARSLSSPEPVFLWYCPAALSLTLLLFYGPKVLPAVILAPLPVDLVLRPMGMGPLTILAVAALYATGYAVAAFLFRRARLSPRLRHTRDVAGFLGLAFLGPLLASFPVYALLRATGAIHEFQLAGGLRAFVLSGSLGILTLAPTLLLWLRPLLSLGWIPTRPCASMARARSLLVLVLVLSLAAAVVVRFSEPGTLHLKYLLFLPMAWVAVRGGLRTVSFGFPILSLALSLFILQSNLPPAAQLGIQSFLCILFGTTLFLGSALDSQKLALQVRDRRSRHLNQLMDVTGAIPWEMDLETGRCLYLGRAVESLLGYGQDVWRGKPFWGEVVHPDDQLGFLRFLLEVSRNSGVHQLEFRLRTPEGDEHWVRAAGGVESGLGRPRVMGFLFDIHAHKHAEENALRTTLREKDTLLREIHHRVKNNLQVVSSLLRLQASTSEDPALQRALQEAQERVQAIALIHQKLKHAPDFSQLDLPGYVRTLAERLVRSYASVPALIDLRVDVAPVDIGPDAPVPLGLILNELVANALQHAFPPGEGGSLDIELDRDEKGWISLRVADSGRGLPESVDLGRGGLGFQLVQALTDQLGGVLELERRRGASFHLSFPPTRRP